MVHCFVNMGKITQNKEDKTKLKAKHHGQQANLKGKI